MTSGVIYQLSDTRMAEILVTSLWSLRQHYHGPVTVMVTRDCEQLMRRIAADSRLAISTQRLRPFPKHGRHDHRQTKTLSWLASPYDRNVFLDADTAVQAPIDDLFKVAFGVVALGVGRLGDGHPHAVRLWREMCNYQRLGPGCRRLVADAQRFNPQIVNTGVLSYPRNHPAIWEMHHLIVMARLSNRRVSDESVMHLVVPHTTDLWCLAPRYNATIDQFPKTWKDQVIVHFSAQAWWRQRAGRECFRQHLANAMEENAGGIKRWIGRGDDRVRRLSKRSRTTP